MISKALCRNDSHAVGTALKRQIIFTPLATFTARMHSQLKECA